MRELAQKIWILEDDDIDTRFLRKALQKISVDEEGIESFNTLSSILKTETDGAPDFLISDLNVDGKGPSEVIADLRAHFGNIRILAYTGMEREAVKNIPIDGFIKKGSTRKEIVEQITSFCQDASPTEDIIEEEQFEELLDIFPPDSGDDSIQSFLQQFSEQAQELIASMRDSIQCNNAALLNATSHNLKGNSLNASAKKVAALASSLRSSQDELKREDLSAIVDQIETELSRFQDSADKRIEAAIQMLTKKTSP